MLTAAAARALALSLPAVVESDHHGFPSYRIEGRIIATLPDPSHLHVMVDEAGILEAVASDPVACEEKWWGKRLACVRITLADADPAQVKELLTDAWRRSVG